MQVRRTDLRQLAARIRTGDSSAADEFYKEIEPQVVRIIRRAIRVRETNSAVARRIEAELGRLIFDGPNPAPVNWGSLIQEMTNRICRATIEGIRSERGNERNALDTVLGN
jgi:hypothetical protein